MLVLLTSEDAPSGTDHWVLAHQGQSSPEEP
jgi:hypothetical protein